MRETYYISEQKQSLFSSSSLGRTQEKCDKAAVRVATLPGVIAFRQRQRDDLLLLFSSHWVCAIPILIE